MSARDEALAYPIILRNILGNLEPPDIKNAALVSR